MNKTETWAFCSSSLPFVWPRSGCFCVPHSQVTKRQGSSGQPRIDGEHMFGDGYHRGRVHYSRNNSDVREIVMFWLSGVLDYTSRHSFEFCPGHILNISSLQSASAVQLHTCTLIFIMFIKCMCVCVCVYQQVIVVLTYDLRNDIPYQSNLYR